MFDLLGVAMANDAMRRQHQRFEATPVRRLERSSSLGRVRLGVARSLRAVADRIEPVVDVGLDTESIAVDRQDAA
jgi:hypothetical protein